MIEIRLENIKVKIEKPLATKVGVTEGLRRISTYTRKAYNQAIVECPVDTGLLRARHVMVVGTSASIAMGQVINKTNYALAVHEGTSPHIIRGKRKRKPTKKRKYRGVKTLRFSVGGQIIFRRVVHHPGSKGRPWLRDAGRKVAGSEGFMWKDLS